MSSRLGSIRRRTVFSLLPSLVAFAVSSSALAAGDRRGAELPDSHVSGSGIHKLFVDSDDDAAMARLAERGAILRILDYRSFRLVLVNDDGLAAIGEPALARVVLRDDLDLVGINGWNV